AVVAEVGVRRSATEGDAREEGKKERARSHVASVASSDTHSMQTTVLTFLMCARVRPRHFDHIHFTATLDASLHPSALDSGASARTGGRANDPRRAAR